jgi:tetratricopeptide (TPR) repeat protein
MISTSRIAAVALALSWAAAFGAFAQDAQPPQPETNLAALEQAKNAFKQGVWKDASAAAASVLEAQPDNPDALYIAGASERLTNRVDDAEGHLKALVESSPRFPLAHFQFGFVLFLQADRLQRDGRAELASAKFSEAAHEFAAELERDPTHADSLSSRAIALSRAGQFEESAQAHEAWISSAPGNNAPVVSLAGMYAVAARPTEAMRALDRLPDPSGTHVSAAALTVAGGFLARKDWDAAVPFLEKAAGADPESSEARALLTASYARAGKADDAVKSLKALLGMDPTPDQAEQVGESIKASFGDGTSAPPAPGVEPPVARRIPSPKYPKDQTADVETVVRVLTLVGQDGAVVDTVLVPNRLWKDVRKGGFEAAAFDAIQRGRFAAGTKDGRPASLWLVVAVKLEPA